MIIPKAKPGSWRLILDLLFLEGRIINEEISSEVCSFSYITVDDAVKAIAAMGQGAVLAKVDISSACRIVPVHPDDHTLLGMMWKRALYVDSALPLD